MSRQDKKKTKGVLTQDLCSLLRAPEQIDSMDQFDANATPGYEGNGKAAADADLDALEVRLDDAQEKLYAQGRAEGVPSVLLILQGLDTAGKGGTIRHVIGRVDPQGVKIKAFKAPTKEELSHHYLWRIRKELPLPSQIGIFDRSHYEDVLPVRVENLVPEQVWRARYDEINQFESELVESGCRVIKCFLHISKDEQKQRLLARLEDPDKYWKYNPGDLRPREKWDDYMAAYRDVLTRCNPDHAPWYVIPANRKWYRNWAIATILTETLESLNLQWPQPDFDVDAERRKVANS